MSYRIPNNFPINIALCIVVIFFVPSTSTGAVTTDSLTLRQIVEKSVANSHSLRQLSAQTEAADARIQQVMTSYYPLVNFDASYANIGPKDNLSIAFGKTSFRMAPDNAVDAHINANIVLYDFGKRAESMRLSRLSREAVVSKASGISNMVAFGALSAAVNLALMQHGAAIQLETIESLRRHLDIVNKRMATGIATRYDVVKTESQIVSAQTQLLDIDNNRARLRITLSNLTGLPLDSIQPVQMELDTSRYDGNPDSLTALALTHRNEIIDASNAIALALEQEACVRKDTKPVLAAAAATGAKNGYPDDINMPAFNWTVATSLHVPLYDGKKERYRLEELEANVKAARETLADATGKITSEVMAALSDIATAYARLHVSDDQLRLGEELLTLAKEKLETGSLTNDEVLDAQRDCTLAKLTCAQNQARYMLSLFALEQIIGTIEISKRY